MTRRRWLRGSVGAGRRIRPAPLRLEALEDRLTPSTWVTQYASETPQPLYGVWGSGPDDVFAVGTGGLILHSANDGQTWTAQASGTSAYLIGVWGSGPDDVFAVGKFPGSDNGVILHSTNGGASWQAQTAGIVSLLGVWGSGPDDVFAVGLGGAILHSSDDGATWQARNWWTRGVGRRRGSLDDVFGVWGSGPDDVFAVTTHSGGQGGLILHSTDDGVSWTPLAGPGRRGP